MTQQIKRNDIRTEEALDKAVIAISKAHPKKVVTYIATLGKTIFYINDRLPTTDTADATFTYTYHQGLFRNGKVIHPGAAFMRRYNFIPVNR